MLFTRQTSHVWPVCLAAGSLWLPSCGWIEPEPAKVRVAQVAAEGETLREVSEPLRLQPIALSGFEFPAPPLNTGATPPGLAVELPAIPGEQGPLLFNSPHLAHGAGQNAMPAGTLPPGELRRLPSTFETAPPRDPDLYRLPPVVVEEGPAQPAAPSYAHKLPGGTAAPLASWRGQPVVSPVLPSLAPQWQPPAPLETPQDPPSLPAAPVVAIDPAQLKAVADQAEALVRHGLSLAERGATYTARANYLKALQRVAQAHDAQTNTTRHTAALAAGLTALKEAEDFLASHDGQSSGTPVRDLAIVHRTPLLKANPQMEISSLRAMQMYYDYAQQQLALAGANEPVASWALYALGRLFVAAPVTPSDGQQGMAKAMVAYQASLLVDSRNHMAANELGVHLAQLGQWREARRALEHSLAQSRRPETLHNLAVVMGQLGAADVSEQMAHEAAQARTARVETPDEQVRWLDPAQFARTAGPNELVPPPAAMTAPPVPVTRAPGGTSGSRAVKSR